MDAPIHMTAVVGGIEVLPARESNGRKYPETTYVELSTAEGLKIGRAILGGEHWPTVNAHSLKAFTPIDVSLALEPVYQRVGEYRLRVVAYSPASAGAQAEKKAA